MVRRILGLTVLIVVAWLTLKVVFGVMTTLVSLLVTLLVFAAVGYLCYLVLRAFNPAMAERLRHAIMGHPSTVL